MRILIVTPEALAAPLGNSITASRWAKVVRTLGHQVSIAKEWRGEDCDLMIALHARRSHAAIVRFREVYPKRHLIVALTGTDLYQDLAASAEVCRSLSMATRVVALQDAALEELDNLSRGKTRIIYQSALPPAHRPQPKEDCFEVCVLSHLRDVKDPMRAALASRGLPNESRIRVIHAGRALEANWEEIARAEQCANPRYCWIGEQCHEDAMRLLTRSRLLVLSSTMEGGANAIGEAVVCGVPVLCSNIRGNVGMLGSDYPGYFGFGETEHLTRLLGRAEADPMFLDCLRKFIQKLQPRFSPERELACWDCLLRELAE